MKKWLYLFAFLSSICFGEQTKTIFNAHTNKLDFITALSTNSIKGSAGITITTTAAGVIITAPSAGAPTLAVGTGTATNFTNNVSSPTGAISFLGSQFRSTVNGATNFISIDSSILGGGAVSLSTMTAGATNYIFNQNRLQSGSTFYVSSGSVSGKLSLNSPSGGNMSSTLEYLGRNSNFSSYSYLKYFDSSGGAGSGIVIQASDPAVDYFTRFTLQIPSPADPLDYGGFSLTDSAGHNLLTIGDTSGGLNGAGSTELPFSFTSSMTLSGGYLVQNVAPIADQVLKFDGTNWVPGTDSTGGGGGGYAVEPATVTFKLNQGFSTTRGTFTALSPGVMFISENSSFTYTALVSLSTNVFGTVQAANFPALLGDVTNTAGSLTTTVGDDSHNHTVVTSTFSVNGGTFTVVGGTVSINGIAYRFPNTRGSSGNVLHTDGASPISTLTWDTDDSGGGGGASTLGVSSITAAGIDTLVSSPTSRISVRYPIIADLTGPTSSAFRLDSSSVTLLGAKIDVSEINATGTADSTKLLRGDGVWAVASSSTPSSNPMVSWFDSDASISTQPHHGISGNLVNTGDKTESINMDYWLISNGSTRTYVSVSTNSTVIQSTIQFNQPFKDSSGSSGNSSQVWTSNGSNSPPTWQNAAPGGSGTTIYSATNTANFPYGLTASTGTFGSTATFNGSIVLNSSSFTKTDIYGAGAGLCTFTLGCQPLTQYQTSVTSTNYVAVTFPYNTTSYFDIQVPVNPTRVANSTFTFNLTWTSTTTAGDVVWKVQTKITTDTMTLDGSFGSAVSITDTAVTGTSFKRTNDSPAVTPGGSNNVGQGSTTGVKNGLLTIRVYRDKDAGNTLTADARLLWVAVRYFYSSLSTQ